MDAILQKHIPYEALAAKPLPGIAPLDMADWLIQDDAYGPQMALRRQLLTTQSKDVLALTEGALPAAQEVLENVLEQLRYKTEFSITSHTVTCPDGYQAPLLWDDPLRTLGQIIQEDICLLEKQGDEHVLTGAVLCFPAGWTLSEKLGKPLLRIHKPVSEYDANIAKRVQRLFDGVRTGRPLWRKNALWYDDPQLYAPRSEQAPRQPDRTKDLPFLRSERQSILRLSNTDAVVFSIHTFVVGRDDIQR